MFLSHRKLRSFSLDVLHSFCNRKITIVERMGRALPAIYKGMIQKLKFLCENETAKKLCMTLEQNGYQAYAVGGCVRDAYMGIVPHDIDITTAATPDKVRDIFMHLGHHVIETGIKHGTVTVVAEGTPYEITTFRTEGGYGDMRHPQNVRFVGNIEQDLSRRDFTVNSIAYSYKDGSVVDVFGGVDDIKRKVIRCVGDPYRRFEEDALRILRALRFASKLGFAIEADTEQAMRSSAKNISAVSAERIYHELCEILCGKFASDVILAYSDVLSVILPELEACKGFCQHSKYHCYDVLMHICKVVENTPSVSHMRFAALLHDIAKPQVFSIDEKGEGHFYGHAAKSAEIAERFLTELKADKKTREQTVFLVRHHDTPLPNEERLIKKRINKIGKEAFFDLAALAEADCKGQSEAVRYRLSLVAQIKDKATELLSAGECMSLSSLRINGNDIIGLGVSEGREVGKILSQLLEAVMSGETDNDRDKLLDHANTLLSRE